MDRLFIYILVCVTFISCQSAEDKALNQVFKIAGTNRAELEKVIKHYKENVGDSLKLKAAKYLIINMPGHCSYTGESIEKYQKDALKIINSEININEKVEKLNELSYKYPTNYFEKVEDYSIITADYLINNIDASFKDWQQGSWAKGISFEEFCEYMLPYKCIDFQSLDNWREYLRSKVNEAIVDYQYNDIWNRSPFWAVEMINKELSSITIIHDLKKKLEGHALYKVPFWSHIPSNTCETRTLTTLAIMRSKGIPVVNDFVLQWPTNANSHLWLNVLIDHKHGIPCEGGHEGFLAALRPGECKGKIYRRTYAANSDLVELNKVCREIPEVFKYLFMKDVTEEYVTPIDLTFPILSVKKDSKEKYVYLTVFDNQKWTPIYFSQIKKDNEITFDKVEKGAIYMPAYYKNKKMTPCGYPALVNENGQVDYLIPDINKTEDIIIKRKYPLIRNAYQVARRLKNAVIQASNDERFKGAVTLHSFDSFGVSGNVFIKDTTKYRYLRYMSNQNCRCNIAELIFYTKDNKKLSGKLIGATPRDEKDPKSNHSAAFDSDPFTYFVSKNGLYGWVGLDFGEPQTITKIGYMIRNDGNNICINDYYELLYWNIDRWTSLGKQVAKDLELTFHHVPQNALLLLRDLSRGKDERIFIYKNNKQLFY